MRINVYETNFRNWIPILTQIYNLNKQVLTFFSTNGCRVDISDLLSYLFRVLNLELKSVAAQFKIIKKALFFNAIHHA